jgi:hypothetical protein
LKRFAIVLALTLASCGGGGSSAPNAAIAPAGRATSGSTADVRVIVNVPRGTVPSSSSRAPQYVSQGTASISATVGGITTSAPCVTPATTCSVDIAAPLGSDTFSISLFDSSLVLLSTGSTTVTIVPNIVNTIPVTFNGVVSTLTVTLSPGSITVGAPTSTQLSIVAKDPDGFTIIQPGNYTQPIVVTSSPTLPAGLSFGSATTITAIPASTTMIPINYTGVLVSGPISFTATAGTVTGSATLTIPPHGGVSVAPTTVQFTTVPGSSSVTVDETNYAGTFTFADSPPGSCTGIVSLGTFAAPNLPLTAQGVGTCTITASDTIGDSTPFTVNVATTSLVGS